MAIQWFPGHMRSAHKKAGETMVGVPAHSFSEKSEKQRKSNIFDAYGTPQEADADPVFKLLSSMQQEIDQLRRRVIELESGSKDI